MSEELLGGIGKVEGEAQVRLSFVLECAVPLWIAQLWDGGGPQEADLAALKETARLLGEKGDVLMFGSPRKGEAADLFNRLAKGIAVLSFAPGGVKVFGTHWRAETWKPGRVS
jgi:hypothetical protein